MLTTPMRRPRRPRSPAQDGRIQRSSPTTCCFEMFCWAAGHPPASTPIHPIWRTSPTRFHSNASAHLRVLDYLLVDQTDRWLNVRRGLNQQSLQRQLSKTDDDVSEKSPQEVAVRLRRQIELSYNSSYFANDPFPINQQEPPYSWLRTTYLLRAEVGELEPFYLFLQRAADAEVAEMGSEAAVGFDRIPSRPRRLSGPSRCAGTRLFAFPAH